MKRPKKEETAALAKLGIEPLTAPKKPGPGTPTLLDDVRDRVGLTFFYHTCQFCSAWRDLQGALNHRQRELEALYGPFVEVVNVYRMFTTKGNEQVLVAIYKIYAGPR